MTDRHPSAQSVLDGLETPERALAVLAYAVDRALTT